MLSRKLYGDVCCGEYNAGKGDRNAAKTVFSRVLELGINAKLNFMPSLEG